MAAANGQDLTQPSKGRTGTYNPAAHTVCEHVQVLAARLTRHWRAKQGDSHGYKQSGRRWEVKDIFIVLWLPAQAIL
eukprot:scaffold285318_cov19-Tisochrysis_lutea.AAC.2